MPLRVWGDMLPDIPSIAVKHFAVVIFCLATTLCLESGHSRSSLPCVGIQILALELVRRRLIGLPNSTE